MWVCRGEQWELEKTSFHVMYEADVYCSPATVLQTKRVHHSVFKLFVGISGTPSSGTPSSGTQSSGTQSSGTLLAPVIGGVVGGMLLLVISVAILTVATWMCVRQRNAVLKGQ